MKGDIRVTLTIGEVAKLLGVSRNSCYQAVRTGELPHIRVGRRLVIPRVALEKLLEGSQDTACGHPSEKE